ncbi:MAG: 3-dehydroquinate synthase [Gammaproteobacteria bacterium]|jgi:3-dehydroquinate synthase|nr:3-dehydroquinate synthase [Gammaproteobacteria bacterium]MBT3868915.1 3-dehydroquinate synthase [Gammaproteobacteria bacterium]MBT4380206.1 3-dehydroquinate synthase [Gammaproteobacteria bacterium]MBT4615885.1 3-dehydroquinate synthase [Gammaproteobacteria bacterium]MBT5199860.1 3-dehydroquinate synthase [Gammaproteobacteria bacterium]
MEKIRVDLGEHSYDICIGSGLLRAGNVLREKILGRRVFVVSNQVVADHYLDSVLHQLEGIDTDVHLMPDGEQFKTLQTLESIIGDLLAKGHNRSTTIVALGGGVVGDTAGYAAASYQRGVPFVQVPTTLLSQVDSSVGGKTAVNHELGKNMIGAFYQPKGVYVDTDTLQTLPERELSAGLAEVIKHGVLADSDYFDAVEKDIGQLRQKDESALIRAIKGSCKIKAAVVAQDERESGERALLNFGHTFAHAIETGMGYGQWLHGEAVGAGMVMAADLSARLGRCSLDDSQRIKTLVERAGLPIAGPSEVSTDAMLAFMAKDKKATDEGLRFVLIEGGIGKTEIVQDVPVSVLRETLEAGLRLCE